MEPVATLQRVLDIIDDRITDKITVRELAREAGFSVSYFCRLFLRATGMSAMTYVTRRKLQYALYDLCRGRKVIDIAMEYGYDTHAGFTKAFKKHFGYPPTLYCIRGTVTPPERINLSVTTNQSLGGILMNPQIMEKDPAVIVGFAGRYSIPGVKHTRDIPVFWETISMNYAQPLSRLHHHFAGSKHCEYSLCFDINLNKGEFTYMLGVGVDREEEHLKMAPDMLRKDLPGGLYAVFTTPMVPEEQYVQSIRDTWKYILDDWLPRSEYEFDESRSDYEYYDERDHEWLHDNEVQMDICIPIQKRR